MWPMLLPFPGLLSVLLSCFLLLAGPVRDLSLRDGCWGQGLEL